MYLHAGAKALVRQKNIIGIFDLDTSTLGEETRRFLSASEKKGIVMSANEELPKSFILTSDGVKKGQLHKNETLIFSQISSGVLAKRSESGGFYD